MQIKYIQPIIKILSKKIGKVISDNQIESLQKTILNDQYDKQKFYKLIFMLKKRKYLIPLKKDLYLVSYPENNWSNKETIIDDHYRWILHTSIKKKCWKNYYIWSTKWIEIHLHNRDIPQEIIIYNKKINTTECVILSNNVLFKTYPLSKKNTLWLSSYHSLIELWLEYTSKITIDTHTFMLWALELCVLESLYYETSHDTTYLYNLIKRAIKKNKHKRNRKLVRQIIVWWKHHTSINRLYNLIKNDDSEFAKECKTIIEEVWFKIGFKR